VESGKGQLYICATPIGNLGDMTFRAVETLKKVDLIAAEDTRNSIKVLNHFDIRTPMTSYHEHNKYEKAEELVEKMLQGMQIAIITDAGTPCISDPGEVLTARCIEEGIPVTSLPGPSAVITALTLSGFSTKHFYFQGFLPAVKQKKQRRQALEELKAQTATLVLYEAPHHLKETLKTLAQELGEDRKIALCREMTKLHEEVIRTTIGEAAALEPRGEYVLVIEGKDGRQQSGQEEGPEESGSSLEQQVECYMSRGIDKKEAMKLVAKDCGLSRRDVYNALLKEQK